MKKAGMASWAVIAVFLGVMVCCEDAGALVRYGFDDIQWGISFSRYPAYPGAFYGPDLKIGGGVVIMDDPDSIFTTSPPNIYGTSDNLLRMGDGSVIPGDDSIFVEDGKSVPGGSVRSGEISGKFLIPVTYLKLDVLHGFGGLFTFTLYAYDEDLKLIGSDSVNLDASSIDPWAGEAVIGTVEVRTGQGATPIKYFQVKSGQPVGETTFGIDTLEYTPVICDSIPPIINSLSVSPDTLWPPNHKMVAATINISASDSPDPVCRISSVSSNEPENGLGDGDMAPDWEITGDDTVNLRAERSGQGSGRVYTIAVTCTDACGNSSTGNGVVNVPHDLSKK